MFQTYSLDRYEMKLPLNRWTELRCSVCPQRARPGLSPFWPTSAVRSMQEPAVTKGDGFLREGSNRTESRPAKSVSGKLAPGT
jgi:hypothetical protein